MTCDEIKKALECHAAGNICSTYPFVSSANCSEAMARATLDVINTKDETVGMKKEKEMTIDELKKALECHSEDADCRECPLYKSSGRCIRDMARAALDALNTKDKPLDQRQMALKTVMMALDKGGYSVTVTPDGEVRMMPWDSTLWISMRDEQPDHDGRYLTFHGLTVTEDWFNGESLDMLIGVCNWYKAKGGWYSMLAGQPIKTVTHWMELPAVPEGWC